MNTPSNQPRDNGPWEVNVDDDCRVRACLRCGCLFTDSSPELCPACDYDFARRVRRVSSGHAGRWVVTCAIVAALAWLVLEAVR